MKAKRTITPSGGLSLNAAAQHELNLYVSSLLENAGDLNDPLPFALRTIQADLRKLVYGVDDSWKFSYDAAAKQRGSSDKQIGLPS